MVRLDRLALAAAALFTASSARSIPQLTKRYDLDGNGIPDLCETTNGMVTCLLDDGKTTTFSVNDPPAAASKGATTAAPPVQKIAVPDAGKFTAGNGTLFTVEYVGKLNFTDELQTKNLQGDKCRTGSIGGKVIWNCGDMECNGSPDVCGFSMGPAFYGTLDVGTVDTNGISNVGSNTFAEPWIGDAPPQAPQTQWGMDTSNVIEVNQTHGIAYVWEIWRGAPDGSYVNRGAGVVSVTLGEDRPIATRMGPLLSGPDGIQLGLLAIMYADYYVYIYSMGGPSGVNVARVPLDEDVYDPSKYQFLVADTQEWETPGAIPTNTSTRYGMQTADPTGKFACSVYGSAFYNEAWGKFVILCNTFESFTMMYMADTPSGPWSETYPVLNNWHGYSSNVHVEYGLNPLYFSLGPDTSFDMFKMTFNFPNA